VIAVNHLTAEQPNNRTTGCTSATTAFPLCLSASHSAWNKRLRQFTGLTWPSSLPAAPSLADVPKDADARSSIGGMTKRIAVGPASRRSNALRSALWLTRKKDAGGVISRRRQRMDCRFGSKEEAARRNAHFGMTLGQTAARGSVVDMIPYATRSRQWRRRKLSHSR
jgi:hypothetical protein